MEEEEEGLPKIHIQKVGESSFAQKAVCFTALLSLASSERGDFSSIVESDARNDNEEIFTWRSILSTGVEIGIPGDRPHSAKVGSIIRLSTAADYSSSSSASHPPLSPFFNLRLFCHDLGLHTFFFFSYFFFFLTSRSTTERDENFFSTLRLTFHVRRGELSPSSSSLLPHYF
jgi:hypothetical protein